MSEPASTPHEHARAEEDHVPTVRLVTVGIGALVLFFLASVTASIVLVAQVKQMLPEGPGPMPVDLGKAKIGMVEQSLFEYATRASDKAAAQRRLLSSYGWVDRKAGVVRIPVDRAMDLVAQGVRP